jgi:hypothetical protein
MLGVEIGDDEYVGDGGAVELGDVGRDFLARWLVKSSSMWSWDVVRDIGFERLLYEYGKDDSGRVEWG